MDVLNRSVAFAGSSKEQKPLGRKWLKGVTDIHVHAGPDVFTRREDAGSVAEKVKKAGMAGVVFKDHLGSTVNTAAEVQRNLAPKNRLSRLWAKLRGMATPNVYGIVVLNHGLIRNIAATEIAKGAKIVSLPTIFSNNHEDKCGALGGFPFQKAAADLDFEKGIDITDGQGNLVPELREILAMMDRVNRQEGRNVNLATGHVSPEEIKVLKNYMRENKLDVKLLVNHICFTTTAMTADMIRELADEDTYFETAYLSVSDVAKAKDIKELAKLLLELPEAKFIVSSDSGQPANPPSPDAMLRFANMLLENGVPREKLDEMAKTNPQKLLNEPSTHHPA